MLKGYWRITQMNKARNSLMNFKTSKCKIKIVCAKRQKISILSPPVLFLLSCQFQNGPLCNITGMHSVFCHQNGAIHYSDVAPLKEVVLEETLHSKVHCLIKLTPLQPNFRQNTEPGHYSNLSFLLLSFLFFF